MTIKPEVLAEFDEWMDFILAEYPSGQRNWLTIRDELTRLAEIADAVDPLVIRLHDVTAKLEAANALLYKARPLADVESAEGLQWMLDVRAHLQGVGHD